MRYKLFIILTLVILAITGSHFGLWQWERLKERTPIYKVIDGDTFYTKDDRIRIAGLDTPERGEPGYKEARDALARLLSNGKVVIEPVAKDKYARTVAKVYVDGKEVAKTMKAQGYQKKGHK